MTRIFTILAFLAILAKGVLASDLMIVNAVAPASLTPQAKSAAVYFMLMNHGSEADRLVGISTPAAEKSELHETIMDNNVMKMRAVGPLDVPGGAHIMLEPGKMHVMLTGLKAPLSKGDKLELAITFEKAGTIVVEADVGEAVADHDHSTME